MPFSIEDAQAWMDSQDVNSFKYKVDVNSGNSGTSGNGKTLGNGDKIGADPVRNGHAEHAVAATPGAAQEGKKGWGLKSTTIEDDIQRDYRISRAEDWARGTPGAVSGVALDSGKPSVRGAGQTFKLACFLLNGFDLTFDETLEIMLEWNQKCVDDEGNLCPWSNAELKHKIEDASKRDKDKKKGYIFDSVKGKWKEFLSKDDLETKVTLDGGSYKDINVNKDKKVPKINPDGLMKEILFYIRSITFAQFTKKFKFIIKLARLELQDETSFYNIKDEIKKYYSSIKQWSEKTFNVAYSPFRAHADQEVKESGEAIAAYPFTDDGNALRLVHRHGENFRYCTDIEKFMIWNDCEWEVDKKDLVQQYARYTVRQIADESPSPQSSSEFIQFSEKSQSEHSICAMISLAKSHQKICDSDRLDITIPMNLDEFDANDWLCNVKNGTYDCLNRVFRDEHNKLDYITKTMPVIYDKDADCPVWKRFLLEIFEGDEDLVRYVQKCVGYSMTGIIKEHMFMFLHGGGGNGKSTFITVLNDIMGNLFTIVPSSAIMQSDNDKHPVATARMVGHRFVAIREISGGKRLDVALVCELTGEKKISTRGMFENLRDEKITHHIWIAANNKPHIEDPGTAIWRRLKLIPFNVTYDFDKTNNPNAKDPDLELDTKLAAERSGIFNWMIEGCNMWQDEGLQEPQKVKDALNEYRTNEDTLAMFIAGRCVCRSGLEIAVDSLYASYKGWAESKGYTPIGPRRFSNMIEDKGYKSRSSNGIRYRLGIDLLEEFKPKTAEQRKAESSGKIGPSKVIDEDNQEWNTGRLFRGTAG